jgi:type I restriction enzyme R subunit
MTNFAFLDPEWSMLFDAASRAEALANSDPRASCFYARRALEISVAWLYTHDKAFKLPYQDTLSALIHEPTFKEGVGEARFTKARLIKDLGNLAVHGTKKIAISDALNATRELFHFCYWLARTYGRMNRPSPTLAFSVDLVPKPAAAAPPVKTLDEINRLNDELHAKDQRLSTVLADKAALDEELQKLREEVAAAKKTNIAQPDTHDYSEAETRRAFIDLMLKEAGWTLNPAKDHEVEVSGMPNGQGKGYVDYVLWGDDGKPLALIEAKRTTKSPLEGEQQAKLYADCLEKRHGQRPVIFLSNGYENWIWDDLRYPRRALQGFYKKAELELVIQRRASRKTLAEAIIESKIVERYYQTRAIRRVGETFDIDNQRKALLVMATGAGKTRTVIALADVLMRCNWAKRVLFLADRVALVNQAVGAFKKHLPDAAPVNLVTDKHTEGRVFVSTYPTMMGLIDEAHDELIQNGVMDVSRLYETPFVDMSPSGPEGIFALAQVNELVTVLELVRARAAA